MSKQQQSAAFAERLAACRVLPVITAYDVPSTVELASVLARAGMTALEITLRTEDALESLREVKQAQPHMLLAAGTVTKARDLAAAAEAGADFCVSPGISETLIQAAQKQKVPLVPGVATPSEVMLGMAHGLDVFKLFPAVPVGGLAMLKSLGGPFPSVRFCPTGGLTRDNFREFLALPNVVCCGGSWMVTEALVREGRWDEIEALARDAMQTGNA